MTTGTASSQTLEFQTEARQLLRLMIHSLYSSREIFLRELVSNAADAVDRLRFEALSTPDLLGDDADLHIDIEVDAKARQLRIRDNGIGMSRDEAIANLGTIARSGTAHFLQQLSGDQRKDANLIGQFGVGFYSSFIVAGEVEVRSRRAGLPPEAGVSWRSKGEADFTVESIVLDRRGTEIILHLNADADEFLDPYRLRSIVRKYSDHIAIPVRMAPEQPSGAQDDAAGESGGDAPADPVLEAVNVGKALWTRPRADIADEEYHEFYRHVSHDYEEPLAWSHNRVEGRLGYTSLLFLPRRAPFDLWNRDGQRGLKLYIQRVFIMDDAAQFLPTYLRFVKGVIDCADLPLNVSREILQQDERVESIRAAVTRRALEMIARIANEDAERYRTFWETFGEVLKEGLPEDPGNRDQLVPLLRFRTTADTDAWVSLDTCIERRKPGQQHLFYLCADSLDIARHSPHLELFRKRGVEVLLLTDRIDEWVVSAIGTWKDTKLVDIARGGLDPDSVGGDVDPAAETGDTAASSPAHAALLERLTAALKDQVSEVRESTRLVDSPVCLLAAERDIGLQMRRILEAAGQTIPRSLPLLEVNPKHRLIERLDQEPDEDRFIEHAHLLLDQARLAAGEQLAEPGVFVQRLNRLLLELVA